MAETIASRVGRIISGSVHALLSAVENAAPEASMEQAIREVDEVIDEVRAELGRASANRHLASSRLMEENRRHDELAAQIEVAVTSGRDDLAEAAIARQLDIEAQVPVLEQAIGEAGNKEKELQGYLSALQAKRRDMQEALAQFIASRAASTAAAEVVNPATAKLERAESAFDRVLARQTGVAGSTARMNAETAAKLSELNELARKNRIQERLAAAKAGKNEQN